MKWWRRVFWRLHDTVITNAFVIYAANNATSFDRIKTRVQFRLEIAKALSEPLLITRKGPGRNPSQILSRLTGKHFPYRSPQRKHCGVCAYKKVHSKGTKVKDKKISTWCPKCEVHLCIGSCFQLYHTRVDYKH